MQSLKVKNDKNLKSESKLNLFIVDDILNVSYRNKSFWMFAQILIASVD